MSSPSINSPPPPPPPPPSRPIKMEQCKYSSKIPSSNPTAERTKAAVDRVPSLDAQVRVERERPFTEIVDPSPSTTRKVCSAASRSARFCGKLKDALPCLGILVVLGLIFSGLLGLAKAVLLLLGFVVIQICLALYKCWQVHHRDPRTAEEKIAQELLLPLLTSYSPPCTQQVEGVKGKPSMKILCSPIPLVHAFKEKMDLRQTPQELMQQHPQLMPLLAKALKKVGPKELAKLTKSYEGNVMPRLVLKKAEKMACVVLDACGLLPQESGAQIFLQFAHWKRTQANQA